MNDKPLSGKRALVTGASGALGSAIASRLAADGASLLLHGHSRPDALQALADKIRAAGGQADCCVFDIADDSATAAAVAQMLQAGPLQIIVNNAGIHDDAVFPGMKPVQWHRVIDVSLHGFFRVTQPLREGGRRRLDGVRLALVGGQGHDQTVDLRGILGGRGSQCDRHRGTVAQTAC